MKRYSLRILPLFIVCLLFTAAIWPGLPKSLKAAPAASVPDGYTPREGDILFQSLPNSPLIDAIEGASKSPYSHCGIVSLVDGKWIVYQAIGKVQATPINEFILQARDKKMDAYRFDDDHEKHIAEVISKVKNYLDRPYDFRYRMDDETIYCSELIYKAFRDATNGKELGELTRLGDLDWQPHEEVITFLEQGPVPLDRMMITPKHLSEANQLECVYSGMDSTNDE